VHGTGTAAFHFHAGPRGLAGITVNGADLTVAEHGARRWCFALTWTGGTVVDCHIVPAA
jgi:hypothetical protein